MADPLRQVSNVAREARRLGKNVNGYFGETIDIRGVIADCEAAAVAKGWVVEEINPLPRRIVGFKRRPARSGEAELRRVYISTGIHGDEPAGPLAARLLLQEDRWPANLELWLCPCLNPGGFERGRRENPEGVDLNRDYREPKAMETVSHIAWLEKQPSFDLCLYLHEDWESHGFYVYEQNPQKRVSLAEAIVDAVSEVCPVDVSETIEGREAKGGIIRPSSDPRTIPLWSESFYLLMNKTRLSYTLEAPSDFTLAVRVEALVVGVRAALRELG